MNIIPIPAFNDNYLWLGINEDQSSAFVVDPGDSAPVLDYLTSNNLKLNAILLTHHHPDHVGGVDALVQQFGCPVYGPATERFTQVTHPVSEGDSFSLLNADFDVFETPGHTIDHISYFSDSLAPDGKPALFCGDTLFAGGCGRLFEGTPSQMLNSLDKLATLPPSTLVFCAHEYTMANLEFALAVEPENISLQARQENCAEMRRLGKPTVPSTMADEIATNPFMRTLCPEVEKSAADHSGRGLADQVSVFAAVRQWKDNF